MRLIHNQKFTSIERESYVKLIWYNIITTIFNILTHMEHNNIDFENSTLKDQLVDLPHYPQSQWDINNPEEYSNFVQAYWGDLATKETYKALPDAEVNMEYFFDQADQILVRSYIPSDQDILNTRMKTTGISETVFMMNQMNYRLVDVGGQRSERRKWIHCFDNVKALLFVAAISEYDQMLREDSSVNRVQEALTLFDSITNSEWFTKTPTILFLNKIDLLKAKLGSSSVKKYFPHYTGDDMDFECITQFFKKIFLKLHNNSQNQVYPHFTHATDTKQMKHIIESINDVVMNQNLEKLGF